MMTRRPITRWVRLMRALHSPRPDIIRGAGVTRSAVSQWTSGTTAPTPERGRATIKVIRAHAQRLLVLCDEIEREEAL